MTGPELTTTASPGPFNIQQLLPLSSDDQAISLFIPEAQGDQQRFRWRNVCSQLARLSNGDCLTSSGAVTAATYEETANSSAHQGMRLKNRRPELCGEGRACINT